MPIRRMKSTLRWTESSPMLIVKLVHWPHSKIIRWSAKVVIVLVKHMPVVRRKFPTVLTVAVFRRRNNVHWAWCWWHPRLLIWRGVWGLLMHSPFWLPHSIKVGIPLKIPMIVWTRFHCRYILSIWHHSWWLFYNALLSRSFSLGNPSLSQCSPVNLAWVLLVLERLHPLLLVQGPLLPRLSSLIPHPGVQNRSELLPQRLTFVLKL